MELENRPSIKMIYRLLENQAGAEFIKKVRDDFEQRILPWFFDVTSHLQPEQNVNEEAKKYADTIIETFAKDFGVVAVGQQVDETGNPVGQETLAALFTGVPFKPVDPALQAEFYNSYATQLGMQEGDFTADNLPRTIELMRGMKPDQQVEVDGNSNFLKTPQEVYLAVRMRLIEIIDEYAKDSDQSTTVTTVTNKTAVTKSYTKGTANPLGEAGQPYPEKPTDEQQRKMIEAGANFYGLPYFSELTPQEHVEAGHWTIDQLNEIAGAKLGRPYAPYTQFTGKILENARAAGKTWPKPGEVIEVTFTYNPQAKDSNGQDRPGYYMTSSTIKTAA